MPKNINKPSLTAKLRAVLPAVVLLPTVSLILSFIMTWSSVGFSPSFGSQWARGFLSAVVVLPFVLALVGLLETQLEKVIGHLPSLARKLLAAAITACVIETFIAAAVTLSNEASSDTFAHAWWMAFSNSLPAGVVIGLFLCFYMKPKLQQMRQRALSQ